MKRKNENQQFFLTRGFLLSSHWSSNHPPAEYLKNEFLLVVSSLPKTYFSFLVVCFIFLFVPFLFFYLSILAFGGRAAFREGEISCSNQNHSIFIACMRSGIIVTSSIAL